MVTDAGSGLDGQTRMPDAVSPVDMGSSPTEMGAPPRPDSAHLDHGVLDGTPANVDAMAHDGADQSVPPVDATRPAPSAGGCANDTLFRRYFHRKPAP